MAPQSEPEDDVKRVGQLISKKSKPGCLGGCAGQVGVLLFVLAFLVAGLLMLYFMVLQPASSIIAARSWDATPCTIISSEVKRHDGDDGDTFSIEIEYEYEVDGVKHRSDRYYFFFGSSSGRDGKQRVVDRFPAGSQATCYVDPNDPEAAVIERGFTLDMLWGLFSLPFLAIGLIGTLAVLSGAIWGEKKKSKPPAWIKSITKKAHRDYQRFEDEAEMEAVDDALEDEVDDDGDAYDDYSDDDWRPPGADEISSDPVTLKPTTGRWSTFLVLLFVALFWNGIVSIFVLHAIDGFLQGDPSWGLTLFLIPFELIGLGLLWGVFYTFLKLFNPVATLTLSAGAAPLGAELNLSWQFSGLTSRLRRMVIELRGREEATYRRGTKTTTDKNTFAEIRVVDTTDSIEIERGNAVLTVPAGSMHSFDSGRNKVVWSVHVRGEIAFWPDVDDEYTILVLPHVGILDIQR